jgi:hypothetical protein
MSTIQTNAIVDASGGNTATVNGISPLANSARFARNLIINGDMNVAQRATSQVLTSGLFTCDRFQLHSSGLDQWAGTMAQVADAPDGFSNSLKFTTTTVETALGAGEYAYFAQFVEAQNLQHLKFGSSSAQSLTVSFWVKSSLTGVFGQSLYTEDNSGMANATYTINTANTWEYKTITYAGDTSRGINNDTGEGLRVIWALAAGTNLNSDPTNNAWEAYTDAKFNGGHVQNALISTDNATIQFTGLQLETGTVATDFEHKTYAEELAACQRYYQNYIDYNYATLGAGRGASGGDLVVFTVPLPTQMRANPTITTNGAYYVYDHNSRTLTTPTSLSQSQGDATKNTNITLAMAFSSVVCDDDRVCVIGGHEANYILFDSEL